MSRTYRVAVLVGSLRKGSLNRMMARALAEELAPAELRARDRRDRRPAALQPGPRGRQRAGGVGGVPRARSRRADAVLFVTPEYNRSVPRRAEERDRRRLASLRRRASGAASPAPVISVSPGAIGGFGANHHLRQSLVFLDVPTLQQPEAYIGGAAKLFDADGKLANDGTREYLRKFMVAFATWIAKTA